MAETIQIATFEGGSLTVHATQKPSREAVLALPLNRLLVKLFHPGETIDLQSLSPYPDEPLTISCEGESPILAAALPEGATDDLAAALDEQKLNVTRVDALALGQLRALMPLVSPEQSTSRRVLLIYGTDCISLFVLDGRALAAIRALSLTADLGHALMLALLDAESFAGSQTLTEIVMVGSGASNELPSLPFPEVPVRTLSELPDVLPALQERAADPTTLNAFPASWQEVLEETRFKAKLTKFLVTAGVVWALLMGVLFGVPLVYGFMTDHQKTLSKEHARRYKEVKEMREKVRLVQKYSDHARGALEILKAVSDRLPTGVELNSWNFRREEGVKFSGESADAASVYMFKDRLLATQLQDESGQEVPLFAAVELIGPSAGRGGKQRFDIDCKFVTEDAE